MRPPQSFEIDITDPDDGPVAPLATKSGLAKSAVKHAMRCGAVWLSRGASSRRLRRANAVLKPGDRLSLHYNARVLAESPVPPTLIHDAGSFSVWDKPRGLRSQGSKWGDHCTIVRYAETHLDPERTSFTVHRLDLATSGVMVVAHSKASAAALAAQFRARRVQKRYAAVVHGAWPHTERMHVDTPLEGKPCATSFELTEVSASGSTSRLAVTPSTGRKHQIRRHLAGLGFPIVGDRLYGDAGPGDPDLQLRAVYLAFDHPETGEPVAYRVHSRLAL